MGKKKNSDFQKIKFKVGRSLPKGTNVTDTSFKAKKIVIRNQLREGADSVGSLTNKKPTVKDYLNRLLNYSPSTRQECVLGLKDLLVQKPAAILPNLAGIIEKACELMVDREIRVRESVLSLLSVTFNHVSPNHITPFFSVVTSYLSCAMTHIVSEIRQSSLGFVDLLLEKYPDQTVTVGNQVLRNFLEQISVEKESSSGSTIRTLAINPSSNLSTQIWRISVLRRVEKFLSATINYWKSLDQKENVSKVKEIHWDGNAPLHIPIYNSGPFQPKLLPNQFTLSTTDPFALDGDTLRDPKVLRNFVSILIPLLKETWIEAQPGHSSRKGNISKNLGETMYSILQVAYLLGEWSETLDNDAKETPNLEFFQQTFTRDFLTQFMTYFPYSFMGMQHHSKSSKEDKKLTLTSLELNLTLCKLYSVTVSEFSKIKVLSGHCYDKVVDYLINIFIEEEIRGTKNIKIALKTIKRMIDNNINEDFCDKLNSALYSLCKNWKTNRKERQPIFDYFIDLCLKTKYRPLLKSQPVKEFLENLPKEIINESNNNESLAILLESSRRIASKGYEPFLSSLQYNDVDIIKLLGSVTGADEERLTIQRYLVEIILNIPKLNISAFRLLSEILRGEFMGVKSRNYLLQVLLFKCFHSTNNQFDTGHFLSLLLCLQFGISLNESSSLQKKYQTNPDFNYFRNNTPEIFQFTVIPSETESWKRHMLLTEDVCQLLMQFPDINEVTKGTEIYLNKLLNSCQYLPIHCVAGILNLAAALNFATNNFSTELNTTLVELALAGLATSTLNSNLSEKLKPLYRCDEFVVITFGFIMNTKNCAMLLCQTLLRQISSTEALSEAETDSVGAIILQVFKHVENLRREQMVLIAKSMQKLKSLNSSKIESKRWYHQACYELRDLSHKKY